MTVGDAKYLLLHTKKAKIGAATAKALREAGYVPLLVEDMDAIKLVAPPMGSANLNFITLAALNALVKSAESTTSYVAKFGFEIAQQLITEGKRNVAALPAKANSP